MSVFADFGHRHSLSRADGARPHYLSGNADVETVVGGRLPGDIEGIIFDSRRNSANGAVHLSTLMTRLPETAPYLPQLSCRDEALGGFADRLVGPGGLLPLMAEYEFESIELNRRYRIGALRGISENRIRQLFAPSFVDFLATRAPDGMLFELFGGILGVTAPGPAHSVADLERLCAFATEVAERVTREAREVDQAFSEEPLDPGAAAAVAKEPKPERGLLASMLHRAAGTEKNRRREAELEAAIAAHAHGRGREAVKGDGPTTRGISLGLPGRVVALIRGNSDAELLVLQASVGRDAHIRPALVAQTAGSEAGMLTAVAAADAEDAGSVVVGGFALTATAQRVTFGDHDRAARARVGSLFAGARCSYMGALTSDETPARLAAARDWLLSAGPDRLLAVAGRHVALVGPATPLAHFDTALLDSFEQEASSAL